MAAVDTIHVPHLWGIDAGYKMAHPYDPKKPTCILINSFTTSSLLYGREFQNRTLTDVMNPLAIEPLGHGKMQAKVGHGHYEPSSDGCVGDKESIYNGHQPRRFHRREEGPFGS